MRTVDLAKRLKFPKFNCVLLSAAACVSLAFTTVVEASFTYSNTTTSAALTVGTANTGTQYTATPVMTGTADDGGVSATGTYPGAFAAAPPGTYSGGGTSTLSYNLDVSGVTLDSTLTGTADALTAGASTDAVVTTLSTNVSTDFTVATTGPYIFTATLAFGGTTGSQLGNLDFVYTIHDDTTNSDVLNDSLIDSSTTADAPGALDETLDLTQGDTYSLIYALTINPGSDAASAPLLSTLTGSAQVTILATQAPEPASLSLLALGTLPLLGRSLRRRRAI